MNTSRQGEYQMFLALMRKKAFGKSVPCFSAPKRWALKCFGGSMTIEQFRTYGGFVEPPIVHWPYQKLHVAIIGGVAAPVAENIKYPASSDNSKKMMRAIESSTTETSTLKLKRQKPLQREGSKLENILGITRKVKDSES
jgi:hypothetical protein